MSRRQMVLVLVVAGTLLTLPRAQAQGTQSPGESAVREAVAKYVTAWNLRDVAAWSDFLTVDVHYIFGSTNSKHTREAVAAYGAFVVKAYDLKLDIVRVRMHENGSQATVVLRGQYLQLPMLDGKYSRVLDRETMLSRWRIDEGRWLLYYMNVNVPQSAAIVKAEGLD